MRIFPAPVEIGDTDGFTKNDIFGYAEFGERLGNLVCAVDHPLTLLLDGPWGSGKTTFIKQWAGHLRNQGVPVIHFDAFANDYHEDPFLALAGEILANAKTAHPEKRTAFRKKSAAVCKVLIRHGATIAIRAATLGAIGAAELGETTEEIAKAAADGSADMVQEFLERQLEQHDEETRTLADFRDTLGSLAATLGDDGQDGKVRPLVVIVDELDRCKPLFAVNLLERVKHLFAIPGVVFLLVTNLDQLAAATEGVYGAGTNGKLYLEKFFDLRLTLPREDRATFEQIAHFIDQQWRRMDLPEGHGNSELLKVLVRVSGIELRGVLRILTHMGLLHSSRFGNREISDVLCIARHTDTNFYNRARSGALTISEVKDFLKISEWPGDLNHLAKFTLACWTVCLQDKVDRDDPMIESALHSLSRQNRRSIIPSCCKMLDSLAGFK